LEKKGEKVRREENKRRAAIFCNNQVRVRLAFNIIKGMVLRIEFNMIRLRVGENWD
jgi:hypothetical protein